MSQTVLQPTQRPPQTQKIVIFSDSEYSECEEGQERRPKRQKECRRPVSPYILHSLHFPSASPPPEPPQWKIMERTCSIPDADADRQRYLSLYFWPKQRWVKGRRARRQVEEWVKETTAASAKIEGQLDEEGEGQDEHEETEEEEVAEAEAEKEQEEYEGEEEEIDQVDGDEEDNDEPQYLACDADDSDMPPSDDSADKDYEE